MGMTFLLAVIKKILAVGFIATAGAVAVLVTISKVSELSLWVEQHVI